MNKKLSALLCTLLLVLTLTACGDAAVDDDITDDTTPDTAPLTLEDFVKESYDSYDYSDYEGCYLPEDGTPYDSLLIDSDGTRWEISRAEDLAASGYLQYSADYDCIYAYNEHDGVAYQFVPDSDGTVYIASFGTFRYESSSAGDGSDDSDDGDTDLSGSGDVSHLEGIWYLDGDLAADSYIYIAGDGSWGLYERAPGAEATEVDGGYITASPDVDDVYFAESSLYDNVTYEFTHFDSDAIMWGGENDYYERLE